MLEILMKRKLEMFIVEIIVSLALGGVMVQSQVTAKKTNSLLDLQREHSQWIKGSDYPLVLSTPNQSLETEIQQRAFGTLLSPK